MLSSRKQSVSGSSSEEPLVTGSPVAAGDPVSSSVGCQYGIPSSERRVFDREVPFSGCARCARASSARGLPGRVVGLRRARQPPCPVRGGGGLLDRGRSSRTPVGLDRGLFPQFPQGLLQDIPEKNIPGAPTFPYSRKGKVGVALPKVPTSATQSTHPGPRSRARRYPKYPPGNVGIPTENGGIYLKYPPFRTVFPAATQSTHPGWAADPVPGAGCPQAGAGLLARGRGACDTDRVTDVGPRTKT